MTNPNAEEGKPRLLVLASTYPRWPGDAEPGFVHELARRLVGDFDVTVLCPHSRGTQASEVMDGVRVRRYRYAPEALETLVNDGGMVTNLMRRPWKWVLVPGFIFGLFWACWWLSRRIRPDVVHAHWLLPQGLVAALLGMVDRTLPPFLVTSHGADLFALRRWPFPGLKRLVVRRAGAVTVVSAAMQEALADIGADTGKVGVEPMGVDLNVRFTPDPAVARSRDELLFVGRLVEKKGLRHLIEAMPEIVAAHPGASLTVAGFGPEWHDRVRQVADLGLQDKVRFLGAVGQDELPLLYRRAAVYVAPFVVSGSGDQEGLGLVVVEAAGCSCPLVVSRLPQLADTWRMLSPHWAIPGDSHSLAKACLEVLASQAAAAARAKVNREALARTYDWKVRSERYGALIGRLVDSFRRSSASSHAGRPGR